MWTSCWTPSGSASFQWSLSLHSSCCVTYSSWVTLDRVLIEWVLAETMESPSGVGDKETVACPYGAFFWLVLWEASWHTVRHQKSRNNIFSSFFSAFMRKSVAVASAVRCLVAQPCPTLCDPMGCSTPGPSVHGDSPGKNTGVGCHALLQGIIPAQGLNPGLLYCKWILCHLSHQGSPRILEWVTYPFSRGTSWPRNRNCGLYYIEKKACLPVFEKNYL